MTRRILITVAGSTDERAERNARAIGRLAAARGWVIVTGGRDQGVMRAAAAGAHDPTLPAPGLTVGVLPSAKDSVAPDIDIAIVTDMQEGRNNVLVMSGDFVVACGVDGPGTASEVALALRNGKRVALLDPSAEAVAFFEQVARKSGTESLLRVAASADDAIARIERALAGGAW